VGMAVVDTARGPCPERPTVPVTAREGEWYLHVFKDVNVIPRLAGLAGPRSVRFLRTGADVPSPFREGTLTVDLAPERRMGPVDVVAIR